MSYQKALSELHHGNVSGDELEEDLSASERDESDYSGSVLDDSPYSKSPHSRSPYYGSYDGGFDNRYNDDDDDY